MKLHIEDDDRQTDAAPELPFGDPAMISAMDAYKRALVRQQFLRRPARDQRPDGDAWAAVGGRPSRRPRPRIWRRTT